jgi:tRNA (cytidine/uridine-2'-O-)-methyltransferase
MRPQQVDDDLHVVLVHPEIPWNTGNVGRTCLAAGARLHLVEPLGFSLEAREVRRAGLDYWPRVDPRCWPSWEDFEARLPELGEPLFFSSEAGCNLWDAPVTDKSVLVFGCESEGLPQAIRRRFEERLVSIPMLDPQLRSLNLSTSVAVALFEVRRRRACR